MTRLVRIVVACAALLMGAAYVAPLWRIALVAPQYPEGLGMRIRVDAIEGFKEYDLRSINMLNHYIGMKPIEPESIPELRFMPVILGVLIAGGLAVAAFGRRRLFYAWGAALGLTLLAGLGDFWKWGYEYGHELDPTAVIKVPGMTYQPPLIGTKYLLNFKATSWPDIGGWALIIASVAIAWALVKTLRSPRVRTAAAGLALSTAMACGPAGPRPFVLHEDSCHVCRMTISDKRYGAEVVTREGRVLTFDSVECLAKFLAESGSGARGVYVIDLQHPGSFIPAESAAYLKDVMIRGPMGKSIVAFESRDAAEAQRAMLGGTHATWQELLAEGARTETVGATP